MIPGTKAMLEPGLRRCVLVTVAVVALACNRYEYVLPECPQPPNRSAIAWRYAPGTPGTVSVTVEVMDSLRQITDARVRLRSDSGGVPLVFDSLPYVRSGVPPGDYTLDVMRIGYGRASRKLRVTRDSAVEGVAVLSPQLLMLDGCGHVLLRTKKPWWEWW